MYHRFGTVQEASRGKRHTRVHLIDPVSHPLDRSTAQPELCRTRRTAGAPRFALSARFSTRRLLPREEQPPLAAEAVTASSAVSPTRPHSKTGSSATVPVTMLSSVLWIKAVCLSSLLLASARYFLLLLATHPSSKQPLLMPSSTLPHLNFRSFVEALDADGDLVRVQREVDPVLEAAAITRLAYEHDGPAPLFENLKGAKDGFFRILGAPNALRADKKTRYGRLARHLALPPTASMQDILNKMLSAAHQPPIDPVVVTEGECKQNIKQGDEIDLLSAPVPLIHKDDGGKYIQTYGAFPLRLGTIRFPQNLTLLDFCARHARRTISGRQVDQLVDRARHGRRQEPLGRCVLRIRSGFPRCADSHTASAGLVIEPQHIWQIHQLWKAEGRDCPWALCFGVPPAAIMAASMPIRALSSFASRLTLRSHTYWSLFFAHHVADGMSEAGYIGAFTGSALEVIICETNDLFVPASSEIVFEGFLSITETAPEGPFGEMHGYVFPGDTHQWPRYKVNTITHRDDAILPMSACGRLTDETHTMIGR